MERYRVVRRDAIVERIEEALKRSGAAVLESADPRVAPFEFVIRTPAGERLELVCDAFTANKYGQQGRPADEHRFQIKYGSEFDRYHTIEEPNTACTRRPHAAGGRPRVTLEVSRLSGFADGLSDGP